MNSTESIPRIGSSLRKSEKKGDESEKVEKMRFIKKKVGPPP
jgi:hypothetical protein